MKPAEQLTPRQIVMRLNRASDKYRTESTITLRLPLALRQALKRAAKRRMISESAMVRQAIKAMVERGEA